VCELEQQTTSPLLLRRQPTRTRQKEEGLPPQSPYINKALMV
jgi:hypothetical protein